MAAQRTHRGCIGNLLLSGASRPDSVLCRPPLDWACSTQREHDVADRSSDNDAKDRDGNAPTEGERRGGDRVRDDQQSGHGSMSALSKLRMIERKRAPLRAVRDSEG